MRVGFVIDDVLRTINVISSSSSSISSSSSSNRPVGAAISSLCNIVYVLVTQLVQCDMKTGTLIYS